MVEVRAHVKWLYVAALASAVVHEIDSAYWQEWVVFGLPGNIQTFLLAHLVVVPPLLVGLVRTAEGARSGRAYCIVLSVANLGGVAVHTTLLLRGAAEFRNAASIAILFFMLASSLALLVVSIRAGVARVAVQGGPA